jgi:hypothetical protein
MKITVPGFVTEQNAQEAMKRLAMKGVSHDARIVAGVATALGLLQQLGGDAAGTPPSDIAALGDIDPSALASLPQEELNFIEADAASRGIDASEFMKFAPSMMKLISQYPKKEIILPDSGEV